MSPLGYAKIHREIFDHWLWKNKPFSQAHAWIDMILLANHKEQKVVYKNQITTISRGEFIRSRRDLAKRWGWTDSAVQRFIVFLEHDLMIIRKPNPQANHISICNYGKWQGSRTNDEPDHEENDNLLKTLINLYMNRRKSTEIDGNREQQAQIKPERQHATLFSENDLKSTATYEPQTEPQTEPDNSVIINDFMEFLNHKRTSNRTSREPVANLNKKDKEGKEYILPDFLHPKLWDKFLSHRKAKKAPVAKGTEETFFEKFKKLKDKGYEPEFVIETIIERGWQWFKPEWIEKDKKSGWKDTETSFNWENEIR